MNYLSKSCFKYLMMACLILNFACASSNPVMPQTEREDDFFQEEEKSSEPFHSNGNMGTEAGNPGYQGTGESVGTEAGNPNATGDTKTTPLPIIEDEDERPSTEGEIEKPEEETIEIVETNSDGILERAEPLMDQGEKLRTNQDGIIAIPSDIIVTNTIQIPPNPTPTAPNDPWFLNECTWCEKITKQE